MPDSPSAYLASRRDEGFGDIIPMVSGQRITLGRAPSNTIILRDDMCSREHAEVVFEAGEWHVADLKSTNGTFLNNERLGKRESLQPGDEIRIGASKFVYYESLDDLPGVPNEPATLAIDSEDDIAITERLHQTRYHLSPPIAPGGDHRPIGNDAVSALYRIAVEMAETSDPIILAEKVIAGLLSSTPAEVGAVLEVKEGRDLEPIAYRTRRANSKTYHKVSAFVSREVLSTRQAVLAENIAKDRHLKTRESLAELKVMSLICAPIASEGKVLGVLHLYTQTPGVTLNKDDLDFTLAVARQFGTVWERLRNQTTLSVEVRELKDQLRIGTEMVGQSEQLHAIEDQIRRVASTKATVLIRGESGVGKELVARAVHAFSPRKDRPFVCLNCAALTETLLESELFGHEKGAFTGATERLAGKFESADGGTIFLDEIGEMALGTQSKFLRVLEGQSFERVGGNVPLKTDVRVVAATNRPLEESVRAGTFRKDLFYRLQVVQLDVPPLRDRPDDIAPIADHFLRRFSRETGRKVKNFTPTALAKLQAHNWPGNVRELRNVVERAVALGTGQVIDESEIWIPTLDLDRPTKPADFEPISLEEMERRHVVAMLAHTDWNKTKAAELLGVERSTLDRKIKAYDLKRDSAS
ncbi:MAG: sigma 54-interacting transcriptional regulator [Gemmataceae bacterium]